MAYAKNTQVSIGRSRAELERLLEKRGVDQFLSGFDKHAGRNFASFTYQRKTYKLEIPVPRIEAFFQTPAGRDRTETQAQAEQEKEVRRRWRVMVLMVKALLEAVDSGVVSFEEVFLSFLLTDRGTVGQLLIPQLDQVANGTPLITFFGNGWED